MSINNFEYLILNLLVVLPTLALTLFHSGNTFRRFWLPATISIISIGFVFILWDIYATQQGHWEFNPDFLTGLYITNLPVEEVAFFVTIPFSCMFLWNEFSIFKNWEDLKQRSLGKYQPKK